MTRKSDNNLKEMLRGGGADEEAAGAYSNPKYLYDWQENPKIYKGRKRARIN